KKMKPVRVYFVCSFLRGLYCLKVCSFQLMENRRVSILKLMGMGCSSQLLFLYVRLNILVSFK
ncbi:acyltransferase, partial [Bacillus sp. VKPM B-3276]